MEVVARNFRARGGEVDIVARRGGTVAFVEVRFREDGLAVFPEETVGTVKRRRIVAAARAWLDAVPPSSWKEARFDVAAVRGDASGRVIRYYPNAFDARGKAL